MSRRSLRLHTTAPYGDNGLLDHSLPYGSASFSVGGSSRRDARKSRPSQQLSVSCSQSLLLQTARQQASQSLHNSSLHSAVSDTSLLSSMLDESSIQERTLVDSFWGLDQDIDPKESTVIAEHSTVLSNSALIGNGDAGCPAQTQTSMVKGYYCNDCSPHSDRTEALSIYNPSSKYTTSSTSSSKVAGNPGPSTIYCRDKSRMSKTGLLVSMWDTGVGMSRRSAASVVYLFTLLYHHMLLKKQRDVTGGLQSVLDSILLCGSRAAASIGSTLTLTFQAFQRLATQAALLSRSSGGKTEEDTGNGKGVNGAHSSCCGIMNVKETRTKEKPLDPSGSLCDDCKGGKQHSEAHTVTSSSSSSSSSVAFFLLGLLWRAAAFTASCLLWLAQRAGSAAWAASKTLLSAVWPPGQSPGKAVSRWLGTIWHRTVCFMSCFHGFFLTRCLPSLLRLLLVLVPLLVLFSLCWWGPAGLLSVLPVANVTEWWSSLPSLSSIYTSIQSPSAEDPESRDVQPYVEPPYIPLLAEAPRGVEEEEAATAVDSARLLQLEQSLAGLWERVEAGRHRTEQRHREVLQMYQDLQQRLLVSQSLSDGAEPWVAGLLDHRLDQLRGRLDEERLQREQTQEQYLVQQQSQASRLAELELLLEALASKTEELQQRQEVAPSPTTLQSALSVGVDHKSHNALLAEVVRLEAALGSVRQDLQGLTGCQDRCERLDNIQETVSAQVLAQVREELRALFYGNQLTTGTEASGDPSTLPDSLLQWLSERYISGADLQASLASLELSILQNVSLQLEQQSREQTTWVETLRHTVVHTTEAAGAAVTEEEVHLIVSNALRLYSQDRTGLADYALESGGGSILSTRCSETYETKTALMSLFGVPLWYYSQSPRTVIQPDVHPGNCWAFRGSSGYLVIRLSMKILPTAFSLEHIPKALAPSGMRRSAPRDFTVYGLDDERQENGKLLGSYRYEEDGEALQTYPVSEENDGAYQIIEVRVLSNWGHQEYTCMYRFRVHGKPSDH